LAPLSGVVRVGDRRLRALLTESLAASFELPGLKATRFPKAPASAEETNPLAGFAGVCRTPGGVLHARVQAGERITRVRLGGGVHVHPASLFAELEQALVGIPASGAETCVRTYFAARPGAQMVGVTPADIAQTLRQALAKARLAKAWGLADDQADALMLVGSDDPDAVLAKAGMVLVPYCAKAGFCGHRNRDTCAACGKCAVGEAYKLARERRLPVRTILRYEHLLETLKEMKARGIQAYLGMCCRDFFIKRQQAFQEAGLPAVLMDISGANCYELKQEDLAYAGTFKAEARLDLELTREVMRRLPKPVAK
jgi:lipoate-protein ligase A